MKKLLMLLLAITLVIGLCACGESSTGAKEPCDQCVDANNDKKCDECGSAINTEEPPVNEPCVKCEDKNTDGKCDVCGGDVKAEPCVKCEDKNSDGKCDVCGGEVKVDDLVLISGGKANFSIVTGTLKSSGVKRVNSLISSLKKLGYPMTALEDEASNVTDCEILIGDVTSRGERYAIDGHDYGYEGYAIKRIDNKIIVVGGSEDALVLAIDYLSETVLGITDSTKKLPATVKYKSSMEFETEPGTYKISSITVGGQKIDDYVIIVDRQSSENTKLANSVQELIYRYYGHWLKTVSLADVTPTDKYILIKSSEKTGGDGFYINPVGTNLEIVSEFYNKTLIEGETYFKQKIAIGSGDIVLNAKTVNVRDVNYEMFGAKGDGKTDDSNAIREAHSYANQYGHTVKLNYNKKYYIPAISENIPIKTNVDFGDAEFIIDDRDIASTDPLRSISVFYVLPDVGSRGFDSDNPYILAINEAGGIKAATCTKLDLGLGYPALLKVVNSNHKNYIRYGANENDGANQTEMVLIDAEGNIDPSTPFMFDYTEVTSIIAFRIDDEPIVLNGGTFTTRANQADSDYNYYGRNIVINRSNVTVKNLTYRITDERNGADKGDPYSAFLSVQNANNVLITDCTIAAHRTYYSTGSGGEVVGMGSYGISANNSNNVTWQRCIQSNFFKSDGVTPTDQHWGIMGSSYSKNLAFVDSTLSRFDAHAGVYNAKIIGSNVIHFRIVGSGNMLIEDSHIYNNLLVGLREDYGAFWDGNITIKNVTMHNSGTVSLIGGTWYSHDFGYPTTHPEEIVIDGLKLLTPASVNVFTDAFVGQSNLIIKDFVNPTTPPKKVTIRNNAAGYTFNLPDPEYYTYFADMKVVIE